MLDYENHALNLPLPGGIEPERVTTRPALSMFFIASSFGHDARSGHQNRPVLVPYHANLAQDD